jgi:riboflavin kinase / FMN adenylyltransferase
MNIIEDLAKANVQQETILTIGSFDGVHHGHQALIRGVVDRARSTGRLAGVVTFHPHPATVLAPGNAPRYLTTPGEKAALFERLGLDLLILLPFDRQVAAMPAADFMGRVAFYLRPRELWVGADFALGRNREGDVRSLRQLGEKLGYEIHEIPPIREDGRAISSSRIRELLRQGEVEEAGRLLGRYPTVSGEVVMGAQRGRGLGYPTANLKVRPERAVPANGVYAVYALLGTERYPGVANVGVRPSFDNGERTVETHIFGFDQEIYGCDLVVEFVARLRDERRFSDIRELVEQMAQDSEKARQILHSEPESSSAGEDVSGGCSYRYREVEHTADRALWVWGRQLPDLFVGAARGMYSLMAESEGLVPTGWREVSLEAWDRESLLIDWLNELLYITDVEHLLFVSYRIKSFVDTALCAEVGGVSAPVTKAHIKAATFHNLEIAPEGTGWSVTVTFDV